MLLSTDTQSTKALFAGAWHVLDFGLARRFVDDDGTVIPQRDKKEFRGSTSYASVAAHKLEDLGTSLCSSAPTAKRSHAERLQAMSLLVV